jgi:hypothetical protein
LRNNHAARSVEWPAGEIDIDTTRDLALLSDEMSKPRGPVDYLFDFDPLRAQGVPEKVEDRP